jgi:uncharacterized protein (DUF58 family)
MNDRPDALSFLDPRHLSPIRSLSLRAKLIVEGMIAGLHRSPFHGFSTEFLEYRPYRQGESARCIDWRKYARTDRPVVRLFEDETNCYARILIDKSASMGFSSGKHMRKYDYARTLAASLAWILIRQRDAVGLIAFDQRVETAIAPRSTNVQLQTILSQLSRIAPGSATLCGEAIDTIARTIQKRGMCILISDLFDDPDSIVQGLRHLRFKRQDVFVVWLLDPLELAFSRDASLQIEDVETGQQVAMDGAVAAEFYRSGFADHRRRIEDACRELKIDCECIATTAPFQKSLLRILEKRRRMY